MRRFVEQGGSLFTTDWALRHVLEPAFPGVVSYNDRPTADAVVRVEVADHDNPFLKGAMEDGDDPLWWLEGSSYPIVIEDPDRVQVLIRSAELRDQWGEDPVAIAFAHGEGEVFHMISPYTTIDTAQVALETTSPNSPGVLRPVGDNGFVHVMMPMHDVKG